jgi:hypothetical protein
MGISTFAIYFADPSAIGRAWSYSSQAAEAAPVERKSFYPNEHDVKRLLFLEKRRE